MAICSLTTELILKTIVTKIYTTLVAKIRNSERKLNEITMDDFKMIIILSFHGTISKLANSALL